MGAEVAEEREVVVDVAVVPVANVCSGRVWTKKSQKLTKILIKITVLK